MKLLLARHGNTFTDDEVPRWIGSRSDLKLTDRGKEQANELASALISAGVYPKEIVSGPLARTKQYAEIISSIITPSLPIKIDRRLLELDYGLWEGKTDKEVIETSGQDSLYQWKRRGRFPTNAEWKVSQSQARSDLLAVITDLQSKNYKEDDWVMIVSSNGKLRFALHTIEGEYQARLESESLSMKTGNISLLDLTLERSTCVFWNCPPERLLQRV